MVPPPTPVTIDVLFTPSCSHVADAEREIARAIERTDAHGAEIRFHEVHSVHEANDLGFPGSPTVRVNGKDVQDEATGESPTLEHCRDYVGPDGVVLPYPPASLVADVIRSTRGDA